MTARVSRACAHRGDSGSLRENTLPAMRSALAKGAAVVEIDVRLTADGDVVVLHDATLDRLWGDPREIEDVRTVELVAFGDADHRPPLLAEILPLFADTESRLVIDMDAARPAAAAHAVVAASGVVVDWCGHLEAMRVLRQLDADARIWLPWAHEQPPVSLDLEELSPVLINAPFPVVDDRFVNAVHDLGLPVTAWTIDDESDLVRAIELGIDTITTNRLDRLQAMIATRSASATKEQSR